MSSPAHSDATSKPSTSSGSGVGKERSKESNKKKKERLGISAYLNMKRLKAHLGIGLESTTKFSKLKREEQGEVGRQLRTILRAVADGAFIPLMLGGCRPQETLRKQGNRD